MAVESAVVSQYFFRFIVGTNEEMVLEQSDVRNLL